MNYTPKTAKLRSILLILLTLVLIIQFTSPVSAASGQPLKIKSLDLQIWPEYDDPRVLAIWDGSLTNTSDQPYSGLVSFNIPKDVEVNMACEIVNGGGHSCQPYKIEDKGDYQVLSWRTTKPIAPGADYPIWLEYYYNPLKGYPNKTMTVDYVPFYNTQNLSLTIKEPLNTTNFKIDPESTNKTADSEGFNNYLYTFKEVKEGSPINLKVSYTRSEKNSSVTPPEQPAYGQQANSTGGASGQPFYASGGGLFLILFIIAAAASGITYFYVTSKRPVHRTSRRKPSKANKSSDEMGSKKNTSSEAAELRKMLRKGEISEETYREMIDELE